MVTAIIIGVVFGIIAILLKNKSKRDKEALVIRARLENEKREFEEKIKRREMHIIDRTMYGTRPTPPPTPPTYRKRHTYRDSEHNPPSSRYIDDSIPYTSHRIDDSPTESHSSHHSTPEHGGGGDFSGGGSSDGWGSSDSGSSFDSSSSSNE